MAQDMSDNLKIYRASAGSGKTFTLALEYIKLLIDNPKSYRKILAVTFTNKATAEMKERILGKLYGVANGLDSAADYTEKLKQQLPGISEEEIRSKAGEALENILHDYGHFRIQTIDAFFQSVLRGLAKELDLNGDMEISLDGEELLNNAVDAYIKKLEPGTQQIAQVVTYIEDKMKSGKKWKIDKDIKDFAKNILNEEYQQRGEALREEIERDNGLLLKKFYNDVMALKSDLDVKAKDVAKRFFSYASGYKAADFKRGLANGSIWNVFTKMQNEGVVKITQAIASLMTSPSEISSSCPYVNEIAHLIGEGKELCEEKINCELSLKHYHQLAMLNNIASTLKDENARENRFMLAETTHLLSTMIGKSATFIFEKIGTEIDHIFIDEFQDTSKLQWVCFKVLLEEVLARGKFNLIVGDVKQSIYRWRNSDWNIMNNIGTSFRRDQITFANQDVTVDGNTYKSTNYRSDRRIITFNNALFRESIKSISTTYKGLLGGNGLKSIQAAYDDVEQAVPQTKPGEKEKPWQGYAEVRLLKKSNPDEKFNDLVIKQLMETLHQLLEVEKVAPRDIAILLRTKEKKIDLVVDAFNKEFPDLKIVSDEAYKLSSSLYVRLVIAALRYIATPEDKVNIVNLIKLYNKVTSKENDANVADDVTTLLPPKLSDELERLKGLPVYELIEQLFALLDVGNSSEEEAYVFAFLDHASQYINSRHADLNKFLAAWDESIKDKCVPAESINSVRVMTIHKSKGLEFHTVILPFCDWTFTGDGRNLIWCVPGKAPFDKISLLPINSTKDMAESMYREDYFEEYLYQIVDNLNILYVATTRAKSNLIMFSDCTEEKEGKKQKKDDDNAPKKSCISDLINSVIPNLVSIPGATYDDKEKVFCYGAIVPSEDGDKKKEKESEKKKEMNPFEEKPKVINLPFSYYDSRMEFRQSHELARFLATDTKEQQQQKYIDEGELMHLVMSQIERKEDLEDALNRVLVLTGLITDGKRYENIKKLLGNALENPKAATWFDGSYKLFNERSILIADSEENSRRPDRVMIKGDTAVVVDYKFASKKERHNEQVKQYIELLKRIGYKNVTGYLWYVYTNKIESV